MTIAIPICISPAKSFPYGEYALAEKWMKNTHNLSRHHLARMGMNYPASISFPFVGLIFAKNSTPNSSLSLSLSLYCSFPLRQSNFHIGDQPSETTICRIEMHLNESNLGRLRCFQDILRFTSLVRKSFIAALSIGHSSGIANEMWLIYSIFASIHFKIYRRFGCITSREGSLKYDFHFLLLTYTLSLSPFLWFCWSYGWRLQFLFQMKKHIFHSLIRQVKSLILNLPFAFNRKCFCVWLLLPSCFHTKFEDDGRFILFLSCLQIKIPIFVTTTVQCTLYSIVVHVRTVQWSA